MHDALEAQARQQISERIARAREPRVPRTSTRHRMAEQLRRVATRLDG